MLFKDIIGQEKLKQQLRLSVQEGRIPHAQLFTGPVGAGKLPLALAYAQYLNCQHRTDEDSCGVCPTCQQFARLEHPDLHFVFPIYKPEGRKEPPVCDDFIEDFRQQILTQPYFDTEDWNATLGLENKQTVIYEKESSEILRKLSLKPFGEGSKVMIIWQAEKMNSTCANKLLKILEEPPSQTVFILITEQPDMLMSTIISRCQQIRVPKLPNEVVAAAIGREDIARIANGNYVVARRLCEQQDENNAFHEDFVALMRNAWRVAHQQDYNALQTLRKWSMAISDSKVGREKQKAFLQYVQRQIRENFIANRHLPELNYQTKEEETFSVKFAPFIHMGNVEGILAELDKAEVQIGQNGNAKIIFFDLCLQMIVLIKKTE